MDGSIISFDSIQLWTSDFETEEEVKGMRVRPSDYESDTGKLLNDFPLFNDVSGSKAMRTDPDGFTVDIRWEFGIKKLIIHFSFGRILNGTNFYLVDYNSICEVFKIVKERLKEYGFKVNIENLQIGRADISRNIYLEERVSYYLETLKDCEMSQGKRRDFIDESNIESVLFYNDSHELHSYDKNLQHKKNCKRLKIPYDVSVHPHTLRNEQRLLNSQKVQEHLGIKYLKDLTLEAYHHARDRYLHSYKKNVYRFDPKDIEAMTEKSWYHELEKFKERYGNKFPVYHLEILGLSEGVLKRGNMRAYYSAVKRLYDGNSKTKAQRLWRFKDHVRKLKDFYNRIQPDLFDGKPAMDLYREMRLKTLAS